MVVLSPDEGGKRDNRGSPADYKMTTVSNYKLQSAPVWSMELIKWTMSVDTMYVSLIQYKLYVRTSEL